MTEKIMIESGLLQAMFRAMDEEFELSAIVDEVPIGEETLQFFREIIQYHPRMQVREWFGNEIDELLKKEP